ncbi:hypothetical protein QBC46DRAFT_379880 [Diplogelasinospora grovesii]|uniref:Coenzyme Q-binding protein COQ10 START domain-containing protein n=1 Tax=Diplogelasinospora grovesii TaxID=303347 RepID=A0AAN6S6T8_9PEZI|nr:hypothetical protein QBC46DRAFT_379880 [Diplogelasinospora grovesii]
MTPEIPLDEPPKFGPPLPTPSYGSGGVVSIVYRTMVAASPVTCLEIMLDPSTFQSWNKSIAGVTILPTPLDSRPPPSPPPQLAHLTSSPNSLLRGRKLRVKGYTNYPDTSKTQRLDAEISVLEEFQSEDGRKGLRVAWKSLGDPWYLRFERTQEFLEGSGAESCEYTSKETFFGALAYLVKPFLSGSLQKLLVLWRDGLKDFAERIAKEKTQYSG